MKNSKKIDGKNIPVYEAAKIMGKTAMFVRIGLQRGILPFGYAFKTDESNSRFSYYISPKLFYEYVGEVANKK